MLSYDPPKLFQCKKNHLDSLSSLFNAILYNANITLFQKCMDESATPELIRTPLENIVLKTKFFNMGPPHSLLALAMDTPKLSDIANTILLLKEMGALLPTVNSEKTDLDGDITFIGSVMSELPLDVRISKLIILGYCLGHLFECIIIGRKTICNQNPN